MNVQYHKILHIYITLICIYVEICVSCTINGDTVILAYKQPLYKKLRHLISEKTIDKQQAKSKNAVPYMRDSTVSDKPQQLGLF